MREDDLNYELNDDYKAFDSSQGMINGLKGFKERIFNCCSYLVPNSFLSQITASVVVASSFMQNLAIILALFYHEKYEGDYWYSVLKYFRGYPILADIESIMLYQLTFSAVIVLFAGVSISTILSCWYGVRAHFSNFLPIFYWVASSPIAEILISPWSCDKKHTEDCFSPIHLIMISVSIFSVILWFTMLFLSTITSGYTQSNIEDPFACFPWSFELVYTIARFAFLIELKFIDIVWIRLASLVPFLIYVFSILWQGFPYYDPMVSYSFASGLVSVLVGSLIMFLRYWCGTFGVELEGDVRLIWIGLVLAIIWLRWIQKRWYASLVCLKNSKSAYELDARIHLFSEAILRGKHFTIYQNAYLEKYEMQYNKEKETTIFSMNNAIVTLAPRTNRRVVKHDELDTQKGIILSLFKEYEASKLEHKEDVGFLLQLAEF